VLAVARVSVIATTPTTIAPLIPKRMFLMAVPPPIEVVHHMKALTPDVLAKSSDTWPS
jgi:hypothetical protein